MKNESGDYAKVESIIIPDSVHFIASNTFESFIDLKSIVVPESVEFIDRYGLVTQKECSIYLEVERAPENWAYNYYDYSAKVYYKGTWEYVDGVPTPIQN